MSPGRRATCPSPSSWRGSERRGTPVESPGCRTALDAEERMPCLPQYRVACGHVRSLAAWHPGWVGGAVEHDPMPRAEAAQGHLATLRTARRGILDSPTNLRPAKCCGVADGSAARRPPRHHDRESRISSRLCSPLVMVLVFAVLSLGSWRLLRQDERAWIAVPVALVIAVGIFVSDVDFSSDLGLQW